VNLNGSSVLTVVFQLAKGCDFDSNHIPFPPAHIPGGRGYFPSSLGTDDIQQQAQSLSGVSRVAGSLRVDASCLSVFLLLITLVRTWNHEVS
jgi:hypothetical protein